MLIMTVCARHWFDILPGLVRGGRRGSLGHEVRNNEGWVEEFSVSSVSHKKKKRTNELILLSPTPRKLLREFKIFFQPVDILC